MIYTIGSLETYNSMCGDPSFKKLGADQATDGYMGGKVWQTKEAAEKHLNDLGVNATHGVFGVLADWYPDTVQLRGEPFRRLLKTSRIVFAI